MLKRLHERVQNLSNAEVLIILMVVAAASVISSVLNGTSLDRNWWANVSQGLVTEMVGAAATFWLINLIFEGRRKREEDERAKEVEKARLIRQMRSNVPGDAMRAVAELDGYNYDWLRDGSLRGANLRGANLQELDLGAADLQGAALMSANLRYTDLHSANLNGSRLEFADLEGVILVGANLKGANLVGTNLQFTQFDKTTILPDGTHRILGTGLSRFTDPSHPQFWRSDDPRSPAYRGNPTSQ